MWIVKECRNGVKSNNDDSDCGPTMGCSDWSGRSAVEKRWNCLSVEMIFEVVFEGPEETYCTPGVRRVWEKS